MCARSRGSTTPLRRPARAMWCPCSPARTTSGRPAAIAPENHLWLQLHDISAPLEGYVTARKRACGAAHRFRAALAARDAAGGALLCGRQPLDRRGLRVGVRAESRKRRKRRRLRTAPRFSDRDAQYPHRHARRRSLGARRPHGESGRGDRPRRGRLRGAAVPARPRRAINAISSIIAHKAPAWQKPAAILPISDRAMPPGNASWVGLCGVASA